MKHIRMKKADADKWLAALRSGEYKQGAGFLCDLDGNYCCLGVLQKALTGKVEHITNSDTSLVLPSREWLNTHGIEFFTGLGPSSSPWLAKLNTSADDANDHGSTFAEIADAIEAELEYTDADEQ